MTAKKIILCMFVSNLFVSCNFFVKNGDLGTSIGIADSKERKVFINEYKVAEQPIVVNDSVQIFIQSAWVEYVWRYTGEESQESEIENPVAHQLIIVCDTMSIQSYNKSWSIGNSKDSLFYGGYDNTLISRVKEYRGEDTLKWKLVPKRFQKNSLPQNSIGNLILIKIK